MNRSQILLEENQYQLLKQISKSRRASIAKLIREAIDIVYKLKSNRKSKTTLSRLAGIAKGTGEAVARNHDHYLYK